MGIRALNGTSKAPLENSLLPDFKKNNLKMTMWADNVKFVKDILDSKYQKIDSAVHEFTESSEALQKDVNCNKSKEHFLTAIRTLELMQTTEIEMLLETIISEMHSKEKEMLESEAKEKVAKRSNCLEKAKELLSQLKL